MRTMRIIGWLMVAYGAVMLVLLVTPWRQWALEHSIAEMASRTDRRAGNVVDEADLPMAVVGSIVMLLAGLWFAILVPWVFARNREKMMRTIEENRS
jgi:uncharacterized membrane protein YbaN (DUF454 family)